MDPTLSPLSSIPGTPVMTPPATPEVDHFVYATEYRQHVQDLESENMTLRILLMRVKGQFEKIVNSRDYETDLKNIIEDQNTEIAQLRLELESLHNQKHDSDSAELDKASLLSQLSKANDERDQAKKTLDDSNSKLNEIYHYLKVSTQSAALQEINSLQAVKKESEEQIKSLEGRLQRLKGKVEHPQISSSPPRTSNAELVAITEANERLKADNATQSQYIKELEAQQIQYLSQLEEFKNENAKINQELSQFHDKNSELQTQIQSLKQFGTPSRLNSKLKSIEDENNHLKEEISNLKEKISQLTQYGTPSRLSSRSKQLEEENETLHLQIEEANKQILSYQDEITNLKISIQALSNKIASLRASIATVLKKSQSIYSSFAIKISNFQKSVNEKLDMFEDNFELRAKAARAIDQVNIFVCHTNAILRSFHLEPIHVTSTDLSSNQALLSKLIIGLFGNEIPSDIDINQQIVYAIKMIRQQQSLPNPLEKKIKKLLKSNRKALSKIEKKINQ